MRLIIAVVFLVHGVLAEDLLKLASSEYLLQEYAPAYDNYEKKDYHFSYGVSDPHTGDHKQQWEVQEHGVVRGSYSLLEPDGTTRIVDYIADDNGFRAVVKKVGESIHPTEEHHGVAAVSTNQIHSTDIHVQPQIVASVAEHAQPQFVVSQEHAQPEILIKEHIQPQIISTPEHHVQPQILLKQQPQILIKEQVQPQIILKEQPQYLAIPEHAQQQVLVKQQPQVVVAEQGYGPQVHAQVVSEGHVGYLGHQETPREKIYTEQEFEQLVKSLQHQQHIQAVPIAQPVAVEESYAVPKQQIVYQEAPEQISLQSVPAKTIQQYIQQSIPQEKVFIQQQPVIQKQALFVPKSLVQNFVPFASYGGDARNYINTKVEVSPVNIQQAGPVVSEELHGYHGNPHAKSVQILNPGSVGVISGGAPQYRSSLSNLGGQIVSQEVHGLTGNVDSGYSHNIGHGYGSSYSSLYKRETH